MLDIVIAFIKGMRHTLIPIGTAVGGLFLGLLFGWLVWPVEVTDQAPVLLSQGHQDLYLSNLAAAYALENNPERINQAAQNWDISDDQVAFISALCGAIQRAEASSNVIEGQRLNAVLAATNQSCADVTEPEPTGGFLQVCLYGLLFLLAIGAAFYFWQARNQGSASNDDFDFPTTRPAVVPDAPPATDEGGVNEAFTPIASYRTAFALGADAYDDSFSIENPTGDFLGECGIGISEVIDPNSPKKVTAMEVWLFDKNDIRTITKVGMSDYAFFDEALKAKLAPKGEPVMARLDEVIVLETAALIINAKITELVYGDEPDYPERSYFERFGVELSVWSKEAPAASQDAGFDDLF